MSIDYATPVVTTLVDEQENFRRRYFRYAKVDLTAANVASKFSAGERRCSREVFKHGVNIT